MPAQPTPQQPAADTTSHATHDVQLLASVADHDHDLDPATRATLDAMVAACGQCAEIAADLQFIATGLADLPMELPAPRDFRLLPEEAARARRGGIWRTLLRPFGVNGLPGLRPLGGALAALGIAGLLVTSFPFGFASSSGAALAPERNTTGSYNSGAGAQGPAGSPYLAVGQDSATSQAPAAGPSQAPAPGGKGDASSAPPQALESAPSVALGPAGTVAPGSASHSEAPLAQSPPPLPILSVALLIAGLALLSLGLAARRFG
jgi:hypothetical protein